MHDGSSDILVTGSTWQNQHRQLWDLLVPSQGPAATVQGEVIRITGRISDEIERNGGGNWDRDFQRMADALPEYLSSSTPLPATDPFDHAEVPAIARPSIVTMPTMPKGRGHPRLIGASAAARAGAAVPNVRGYRSFSPQ